MTNATLLTFIWKRQTVSSKRGENMVTWSLLPFDVCRKRDAKSLYCQRVKFCGIVDAGLEYIRKTLATINLVPRVFPLPAPSSSRRLEEKRPRDRGCGNYISGQKSFTLEFSQSPSTLYAMLILTALYKSDFSWGRTGGTKGPWLDKSNRQNKKTFI